MERAAQAGVPTIRLRDVAEMTFFHSDDRSFWYRDSDMFRKISKIT
ncbi:MAG: hypothetical protein AB2693_31495 [Candidatus Thiodiazotropha sp.]